MLTTAIRRERCEGCCVPIAIVVSVDSKIILNGANPPLVTFAPIINKLFCDITRHAATFSDK